MRVVVLQPPYPSEGTAGAARACLEWMSGHLRALCPGAADLIVLPEYANAPGLADQEVLRRFAANEGETFVQEVSTQAARLGALVAVGKAVPLGRRWVNQAVLLGPSGEQLCEFSKPHLTAVERDQLGFAPGGVPTTVVRDGVSFGFAVCFDLYFPEYFATLAARGVNVVIAPSYQRSESADRIRLICRTRALDAGVHLVRSSYALGSSDRGGCSLVAAPDGEVLADAGGEPGLVVAEFDPLRPFSKPASHGQGLVGHRDLVLAARRPGLYRPRTDSSRAIRESSFPWLCAHRGLSQVCPENTLPAFGAALGLGVQEIELDLWLSRDGVPVVCHDPRVDRTTDGQGVVTDMDWGEVRRLDAGVTYGESWRGVRVPCLDEVIALVDGRAGLNIHIKDPGPGGRLVHFVCDSLIREGLVETSYIAGDEDVLAASLAYAPEVPRACLAGQGDPVRQVGVAARYACRRIQFSRAVKATETGRAHDLGMVCNLFWSDEPEDAREYAANGIDVLLTNAAHRLAAGGIRGWCL